MPDFHHIFYKRGDSRSFLSQITPDSEFEAHLKAATTKVRVHLRKEIRRLTEEKFGKGQGVTPKFIIQGSEAYRTSNLPCHQPPQEIDVDLGVYVPVGSWDENEVNPKRAAREYFDIVEEALAPLVKEQGWSFGTKKDTCVRIILPGSGAHIDVPLYAAPDEDFANIQETALRLHAFDAVLAKSQIGEMDLTEEQWFEFRTIRLAMRDGTWKDSDPRKVTEWFEIALKRTHGEQLRRVCRYLKAARDFYWKSGGPSSILLMICANRVFKPFEQRDDKALAHVLKGIGALLAGPVIEVAISPTDDFNRMTDEEKVNAAKWARQSGESMVRVIENSRMHDLSSAFAELRQVFGDRIPAANDLVQVDMQSASSSATMSSVIAQPALRTSHAG